MYNFKLQGTMETDGIFVICDPYSDIKSNDWQEYNCEPGIYNIFVLREDLNNGWGMRNYAVIAVHKDSNLNSDVIQNNLDCRKWINIIDCINIGAAQLLIGNEEFIKLKTDISNSFDLECLILSEISDLTYNKTECGFYKNKHIAFNIRTGCGDGMYKISALRNKNGKYEAFLMILN